MRFTMKKTLALMMALMLVLPTFVHADDGQVLANELALDSALLLDGDLSLDGLSLELPQPQDPIGDLELGAQDPEESGAAKQPDAPEAGAPEEPQLELGDDAQGIEEVIPVAQPLMPPDNVLEVTLEGENGTDPALAANDDVRKYQVSTWGDLSDKFRENATIEITLEADCEKSVNDAYELVRETYLPLTLNLNNHIISRKDLSTVTETGYVIRTLGDSIVINGPGTIKGGKNSMNGGGIVFAGGSKCQVVMNGGTITDNTTSLNGGGVDIESGPFTMTGGTIKDNSADGNGGGVYINYGSVTPGSFTMTGGAIKGNSADGNGGGVYVDDTFNVGETNKTSEIQIFGNRSRQNDNNVYLPNGKLINVIGKLSEKSVIGVTTQDEPNDANGYIPITNSFSSNFLPDVSVFKSDDTKYAVGVTEENGGNITLGLGCEIEHTSSGADVVYDGQSHGITVDVTNPDPSKAKVKYKDETGQYAITENPTFKDVGSYTVEYEVSYKATGGEKSYYFPAEGKRTVTITPKDVALEWKGGNSYTYNGQGQGPDAKIASGIVGQDDVSVTVKYKVKDADDSTLTDQKPVDVGDYVAVTKLSGAAKDNYSLPKDAKKEFTITTKTQDNLIITLSQTEYTYDGTAKEPAVTVTDKDTSQVVPASEYEVAYSDNVDAGTAKVTLADVAGGNYIVNGDQTFTIKKANMVVEPKSYKGVYDGEAHGITVNVIEPSTGYTIKYGTVEGTYDKDSLTYTDAGVYTVYYQVTAENYETVTGSATVEITANKKTSMTVVAEDYKGEYDREAHGITVDVIEPGIGYTIKYGTVEGTYDKDSLTYTDAGVYTVYYQVTAENYETVTGSATVEITADKKTSMTVVAEDYKGEYDREAHGIKVTVTEPKTGYTVKYSTVDGTYDKDSLTYTDTGVYTVYYQVTAENYETVTGSATVEITARVPTDLTIDLSGKTYYYYAKARKPTVTVKDGDTVVPESEYRVTYKNNIHAGTATVKITSFTKGNYSFAEERNFTIKPRNVHLKYTKLTFTYDGKYHLPLAKAIGVYPADENKYTVQMTGSGRNVGRYIARTTGIDNPDYHMLDVGEETRVIFYINPRGGRGSGSGNTRFVAEKKIGTEEIGTVTYDGKAQEPKFAVKCVIGGESNGVASNEVLTVPASEYRVTYHNNVDAGTATVEVTDVPGGNYIVDFRTEFTIARREVTVTANDQRAETADDVKTGLNAVKAKGLAKGHTLESVKLDIDIETGAKKGEIIPGKAKIVDAEGNDVTKNYSISYKAGQLTVAVPTPDLTLLAEMKSCDDRALRVSWTQVVGADGYEVTFVREDCSFSKAEVVSVRHANNRKFTDLKKNTAYKAYVRAWKLEGGVQTYIGKSSPVVCAITGNVRKNKTNAACVSLNVSQLKLNVGGKAKVKGTVKGVKAGKDVLRWEHTTLRWYSTNTDVATVNANGEIKAVGKGKCTVYALAANGARGSVTVSVN